MGYGFGSKIQLFDDSLECVAALQELFHFIGCEVGHDMTLNGTVSDERGKREADIAEAVLTVQHCGDHEGRAVNAVEGIADRHDSRGNCVIGAALAADDRLAVFDGEALDRSAEKR